MQADIDVGAHHTGRRPHVQLRRVRRRHELQVERPAVDRDGLAVVVVEVEAPLASREAAVERRERRVAGQGRRW